MSPQTLRRFFHLAATEKRMVLASAAALLVTRVGLRICGFRRWQEFLGRFGAPIEIECRSDESFSGAQAIARLQAAAERHLFYRPSCLEHSLVLRWMLSRAGIPAKMVIGGRKQGTRFEAHAWVEVNGTSLDNSDAGANEFVRFDAVRSSLETEIS